MQTSKLESKSGDEGLVFRVDWKHEKEYREGRIRWEGLDESGSKG